MVAEPVQASLQALQYYYDRGLQTIHKLHQEILSSDLYGRISTAFGVPPLPPNSIPLPHHFLTNKKVIAAASILTIGMGAVCFLPRSTLSYITGQSRPHRHHHPRRRSPKVSNGARKDVVLVIGLPTEPLTRLVALDFERRGFIVFLSLLDETDVNYIEANPITDDLKYLNLASEEDIEVTLSNYRKFLDQPVTPFPGAESHCMKLVGVVFAPSVYFSVGPIETIPASSWARLHGRLELFTRLMGAGLVALIRHHRSKTIYIGPSIISDLNAPFQAPQVVLQRSLEALFLCLARELSAHGLLVTQVKLGNLRSSSSQASSSHSRIATAVSSQVRGWSLDMRQVYGNGFAHSVFKTNPMRKCGGSGTSLVQLYHLLFDLIYSEKRNKSVVFCGTGARTYSIIAWLFPESFMARLLK